MMPYPADSEEHLYLAIDARMLMPGTRLPFDVFFRHGGQITSLFLKGTVFTNKARDIILTKDIRGLYIRSAEKRRFEEYLAGGQAAPPVQIAPSRPHIIPRPPVFDQSDFFQIDRSALAPYSEITFDLYIQDREGLRLLIEASEKYPVRLDDILLANKGDILIDNTDIYLYRQYLKQYTVKLRSISDKINAKIRATLLKENSKLAVLDVLKHPESAEFMKTSSEEVNAIVDAVLESRDILFNLIEIRHYDYYTYTHSVNVAVLSIGLGINIGMSRDMVESLGVGALLHDIGKSTIRNEILNKRDRLSESEFEIMKTHVPEGEQLLRRHPVAPESLTTLREHHEKISGCGYPLGLTGRDISVQGRIASIVDSYDALITNRPYKPAYTPFYALSTLTQEKTDYDHEILRAFIEMLGRVK